MVQRDGARLYAYCHDSVGIGHLARTTNICHRVNRDFPSASFLIATGTPYVPLFDGLASADYIKLPALEKTKAQTYRSKFFTAPISRLMHCRQEMLRHSVEYFDPTIVLVDKAPLGVCGEFLPALRWLRINRPNTKIVFGMRDIEDAPEPTIDQWARLDVVKRLEDTFDEIWVYGMRDVFDVVQEYRLPSGVASKIKYTGYVAPASEPRVPSKPTADGASEYVLVTVGGGTDGESLLRCYLDAAASRLSSEGMRSVIVGGPDLPAHVAHELRTRAAGIDKVEWVDFDPNMGRTIRDATAVVSMGGYNTLCQIASQNMPALIIPRTKPRMEQAIRAKLWSARGVVEVADAAELTPAMLADRVCALLRNERGGVGHDLDFTGLERVSKRFESLLAAEGEYASSVRL